MQPAEAQREHTRDWLRALDDVLDKQGADFTSRLLIQLERRAAHGGVETPLRLSTPYVNTIARDEQPSFSGDLAIERRLENWIRWNAMAMVVRANRRSEGIGGHLSTYASAATLFEVGFNHFFRGKEHEEGSDQVYFQGHASPGVYARAFLEGRLSEEKLDAFRREIPRGTGLSSYPHPWLMPDFWEFPTVSMGLAPLLAIHQARFNRYLEARGLVKTSGRVWALVGDGEMDEPESIGAITDAGREGLGNLTLVVNCNLQRLDGPVRGNSKIIQELEALFCGAGWRVIKVVWGSDWDPLLDDDEDGALIQRMDEAVDGDYQKYVVEGGAYFRKHFFGSNAALQELVRERNDEELARLSRHRGGHDIEKVFAAYRAAEAETRRPTVILAKTVKGYGLGEAVEARNVTHKTKSLDAETLKRMRDRLAVPIADDDLDDVPYYRPPKESEEMTYVLERREKLGGPVPLRSERAEAISSISERAFQRQFEGSGDRPATTTMAIVRLLSDLLKDEKIGSSIVPIVPDEARTFGLEALFPQVGIYSPRGQRYDPVDSDSVLFYREARDGQILEEGISEAGAMASFIAAGTAYATHGINAIPFYFFYSMFGFQRTGDLAWAAIDARCRGFLIGATSGRTTLNGEGLQHQDGHSHLLAHSFPRVVAYDPAYGYELGVIVRDGIRRMYEDGESCLYYITVANEPYEHPPIPDGVEEGIVRGMYRLERADTREPSARILASGPMVRQAIEAKRLLTDELDLDAEVFSVTSWKNLYVDAIECERHNRLHPEQQPRSSHLERCLGADSSPVVAVSDFVRGLSLSLAHWLPEGSVTLGTDGLGRSDTREALRDHFEVDAKHIAYGAITALARVGRLPTERAVKARNTLGIDPDKTNPITD